MMLSLTIRIALVLIMAFPVVSCHNEKHSWPTNVTSGIWVSKAANNILYVKKEGTYEVTYDVKICYPAKEFIEKMVNEMVKYGWYQLEFDFLNPSIRTEPAQRLAGWKFYLDASEKLVWHNISDWEDNSGNVIRYTLSYSSLYKNKSIAEPKQCDMHVVVFYAPAEIRKKMLE